MVLPLTENCSGNHTRLYSRNWKCRRASATISREKSVTVLLSKSVNKVGKSNKLLFPRLDFNSFLKDNTRWFL